MKNYIELLLEEENPITEGIKYSDFDTLVNEVSIRKEFHIDADNSQKLEIRNELAKRFVRIRNDMRITFWTAILLFVIGSLFYTLYWTTGLQQQVVHVGGLQEIIIVFMWVFVWTGVDRLFFALSRLRKSRKILLRIGKSILG